MIDVEIWFEWQFMNLPSINKFLNKVGFFLTADLEKKKNIQPRTCVSQDAMRTLSKL